MRPGAVRSDHLVICWKESGSQGADTVKLPSSIGSSGEILPEAPLLAGGEDVTILGFFQRTKKERTR